MHTYFYIAGAVAFILLVFRWLPVDGERFHDDPAVADPRRHEVRLIGFEAPRFEDDAGSVLETFIRIATSDWGVSVVHGDVQEGLVTMVVRSKVFGFRDYVTAKAVDEGNEAKLSLLSRPGMNVYDWGVNQKRLDRWLQEMEQAFPG